MCTHTHTYTHTTQYVHSVKRRIREGVDVGVVIVLIALTGEDLVARLAHEELTLSRAAKHKAGQPERGKRDERDQATVRHARLESLGDASTARLST
jgi:hypothetical protein